MPQPVPPATSAVRLTDKILFGTVLTLTIAGLASWFGFDQWLISLLSQTRVSWKGGFWGHAFTRLGKVWLQTWLLLVWFLVSRRRHAVLAAFLALVIVGVIVNPLKVTVGKPRPHQVLRAQAAGQDDRQSTHGLSFPSGDTAAAFAVTTAVLPAVGWPLRLLLLGACAAIGGLRVAALAHYPSDVLCGAAIGLLAGWLATRLLDRWSRLDRALPFESWLILAGIIGIPVGVCIFEGPAELLLVLRTYGLPVLCAVVAAEISKAIRGVEPGRLLLFLTRMRPAAMVLGFAVVIAENVLDRQKPHELSPLDQSVSLVAAVGFTLVVAGALIRFWAWGHRARGEVLAVGPYAIVRHPLALGSLLVVCGILLQLHHWLNWLVIVPLFVLLYGTSLIREERSLAREFGDRWQSYRAEVPAVIPSLRRLPLPRDWSSWNWGVYAGTAEICITLVLVCLPFVIEFLVEDLLFERLLGV
jgi:protein-S-isoprenylcysteine O-methyltransferase Ste14